MNLGAYGTPIQDDETFVAEREMRRQSMGADVGLRHAAVELQIRAEAHGYGYQQEWCGVPVIRLPDDIAVLQEIIWALKPALIVETGVARGGSLVLSASLMSIAQCDPRVLGLDLQILAHTQHALAQSPFADAIATWEGDSAGDDAARVVAEFIADTKVGGPAVLILDSDHSHAHVLRELRALTPHLPVGSLVLVADTLVEEMPAGHYPDRPWDRGDNPLTAVRAFLEESSDFVPSSRWGRRGLLTEFRDGVLEKVARDHRVG